MLLADAIENWGLANRTRLADSEVEMLRRIWSTIRASDVGAIDTADMTPKDRKQAMGLFDKADRPDVAATLNTISRWTRNESEAATLGAAVAPSAESLNGSGRVHLSTPDSDDTESAESDSPTRRVSGLMATLYLLALAALILLAVYYIFLR